MSLRDDFEAILRDYGWNVLLIRQGTKVRCSCWDERKQESSRECPVCFGLAYVPIIEKHTVRDNVVTVPETLARTITEGSLGNLAVPTKTFYFAVSAKITLKDMILEVDWSKTGKPIYNGGRLWEVNNPEIKKFERGEPVFQEVSTKDMPLDKTIRAVRITAVNGIKNYEIEREG